MTSIIILFAFIFYLGSRVNAIDLLYLNFALSLLIVPAVFYQNHYITVFNNKLWEMPVPADEYFGLVIPCLLLLFLGMSLFRKKNNHINKHKSRIVDFLKDKGEIGTKLFLIGFIFTLLSPFSPILLRNVFYLGSRLIFVGIIYLMFSPRDPKKTTYYISAFIITMTIALKEGMFGELVYWSGLTLVYYATIKDWGLIKKLLFSFLGFFLIFLLQTVKHDYRKITWGNEKVGYAESFSAARNVIADKDFSSATLTSQLGRYNQGFLTSLAMNYTPMYEPYANGETIFRAFIAGFVPRLFWPDKPKTGGAENMLRFTGTEHVSSSFTIGQMGDAYVNFGLIGGAFFMFFYGMLLGFTENTVYKLSAKRPDYILWLPFIFITAILVESDINQVFNQILKASFFMWMFFKFFKINEIRKRTVLFPPSSFG